MDITCMSQIFLNFAELNMKQKQMKIKFEGQTHQIDANTLINVLIHYQNIVEIANRELGGAEKQITVRVNAPEKGSFILNIDLVQNLVQQLFSNEGVTYVASLITVVEGTFNMYKHFKGKPIKEQEQKEEARQIITQNGQNNYHDCIVNIYNFPPTREAISKSIETANNDICVDGISVHGNSESPVVFSREDFEDYIYNGFDKENGEIKERIVYDENAILSIMTLGFEKGDRWMFFYDDKKIPISNKDETLLRLIDNGARFGKGDAIRVKLQKKQRWLNDIRVFKTYAYKIEEFYEHIKAPTQGNLFE